jgi:hypothetical protein
MKAIISLLLAVVACAGCTTGSHVVTGTVHPAIPKDTVRIYQTMPQNCEVVGLVDASTPEATGGLETLISKVKKDAASMGANGVILSGGTGHDFGRIFINGQAIFVR